MRALLAGCRPRVSARRETATAWPVWLAPFLAGAKATLELGWQPRHPTWRRGFAEVARLIHG
jgi:hypothetical protein